MLATLMAVAYFGDLHIHTSISSDAVGSPAALFQVARVDEDLDFIAITDHDSTMDAAEWTLTKNLAAAANVPGEFVAFSGIEWTLGVHLNVYFLGDNEPYCTNCNTLTKFYNFYGARVDAEQAGAQINHPANQSQFAQTYALLYDTVLRNVEIKNGRHYAFDQEYGPKGAVALLSQGYRLGFVGTSDDHSFDGTGEGPRRLGDTLTGCHATSLTRAGILEALRNRRCFATDNLRTVVDMNVAGAVMGSSTQVCEGGIYPVDLFVSGTKTPSLVEIVQDGNVIASRSNCTSPSCDLSTNIQPTASFINVYGRVTHPASTGCVNCKTWASPVKVFTTNGPQCPPPPTPQVPALQGRAIVLLVALLIVTTGAVIAHRRRMHS